MCGGNCISKCCATKVRLSIAFRNEGGGSSLERLELNSERDEQVSTKNEAVWRERGYGQPGSVTGNTVLTEVVYVSGS